MNVKSARYPALVATLVFSASLNAQSYRGAVNGNVRDATGAAVPNAAITALDNATNISYKAASSSAGEFTFSNLPIGSYTLTVTSPGFSTAKYDKVQIEAGAPYTLAARLSVSSSEQTVEVDAGAIAIDTTTDIQATTLPEVIVQNLPNSGRDFTQMIAQTTGFAGLSSNGGAGVASVNGTRSNSVNWQIEGTDNNDLWWNIPAVNQGGVSAIAGVVFPIDAIESFNFVTTGSTTLGRNPGGTANLIVKSGGNALHGSVYYSNHNEYFQHNNPFNSSRQAKSRLQDYGFLVSGPVLKDKFFFLFSGEHQSFLIGGATKATEPTLAYQADAYRLLDYYGVPHSSVAAALLNGNGTTPGLYPAEVLACPSGGTAPDGKACNAPLNYQATGNLTGHSFNGLIKLDSKLTDKDTLSARWYVGQGTQTAPTSSALTPYFENAPIHVDNFSLIYNRIITSSIANQLSAGVSYFNQVFSDADNSFSPASLGLNTGVIDPTLAGAPHLVIGPTAAGSGLTASNTGFDPTGVTAPSGRNDITGHADEDLSWVKGAHQMHFGGEYRQAQVDDFYQTGQRGTLNFDGSQGPWSTAGTPCAALATNGKAPNDPNAPVAPINLADFLAGCINPSASSIVLGNPKRQVFETTFAAYAQDAWQLNKKLNINLGFRYDYEGPFHSEYPNLSIFDPTSPTGLAVVGNSGNKFAGNSAANVYKKFWGAASPRVGFAYQVDNTGKTVLRGGYGFYYDSIYIKSMLQNNGAQNISVFGPGLNPAGSDLVANAHGLNQVIKPGVDIFPTLAATVGGAAAPGSVSISTFDPNFRPSDTQLWNLNLQHTISNSIVWQIGYVGSKGSHLLGLFDINPQAPSANGPDTTTRPYYSQFPQFGVIDEARSNLGSIYHSLQTTINLQSFHGLTAQLAYTWSHSLDYETGLLPYVPQDPRNEKAEYGNSDFDVRNTVTGYFDYAFPAFRGPKRLTHGWEANSGFSLHGGTPYTVIASQNVSGNGEGADRAVQVIGNPLAGVSHAIVNGSVQWFNPAAFADPAAGSYSPTRRGQNYNPGYEAVDLALIKNTAITERVQAQFKANLYNIFNHTNLAPVGFPSTGDGDGTGSAGSGAGSTGSTIGPYLGNPTIGPGEPLNAEFSFKILF